jgi:predicted nucleic-acid-binding Zn-ribbon protein
MTMNQQICPKCQGEMEQGFVLEISQGGRSVISWSSGQPKKSFFFGIKLFEVKQIPIGTFRCKDCGYLESFARPEFDAH